MLRGLKPPVARPLVLALAAIAVAAPAAAAAPVTVQAVNGRGVEQVSLVQLTGAACPAGCTFLTDGHGRLTLDVAAGDHLAVTRGGLAPEGSGVGYVVPAVVPSSVVRIALPALLTPVAPQLDSAELWLLQRVNQERAALGRAPLQRSATLDRAADAYAHYLLSTGQFSHTALADPPVRAIDQGWPVLSGAGEALALAPSKESALAGWRASSPHWTLLMLPSATAAGVGHAGNRWIISPAACAPTNAPERCELGVGAAPPQPPAAVPPAAGGTARSARLRMKVRRHGRRLTVAVRLIEGSGTVRVRVSRGKRHARVRTVRRGSLYRARARLTRAGRWRIAVSFDGAAGWANRRLPTRVIRVPRQ